MSPFLFSLYTSDSREENPLCSLIKYADDTCLTGNIIKGDDEYFIEAVSRFVQWCDQNYLELNVGKTKELLIDFRKSKNTPDPVTINNKEVERVESFKYLGVIIDNKLSWNQNTDSIVNKLNTRLYCLRKLNSFNVNSNILQIFYTSIISSVLTFGSSVWGRNINQYDRDRLDRIIKKAGRIIGKPQICLGDMTDKKVYSKLTAIFHDKSHPLWTELNDLVIDRSGRLRMPKVKTKRYRNSFIPNAVKIFNNSFTRDLDN